jgi:hypothetical protein
MLLLLLLLLLLFFLLLALLLPSSPLHRLPSLNHNLRRGLLPLAKPLNDIEPTNRTSPDPPILQTG